MEKCIHIFDRRSELVLRDLKAGRSTQPIPCIKCGKHVSLEEIEEQEKLSQAS